MRPIKTEISADERALMDARVIIFSWDVYKDGKFAVVLPWISIVRQQIRNQ